jgi:hypothetical protein
MKAETYNPDDHFCMVVTGKGSGFATITAPGQLLFTGQGRLLAGCKLRIKTDGVGAVVAQDGPCGCGSDITMGGEYARVPANASFAGLQR